MDGSLPAAAPRPYATDFLHEVERHVEGGEHVKMCMQCGVCAGSCPLGAHWEHSPQKIFMMIRAGKREEVLRSNALWLCTSCYNCVVRCPRKLPVTTIIHGLATYAHRLGLAPRMQPTRDFSLQFWKNITRAGRANEVRMTFALFFKEGIAGGVKKGWAMRKAAQGLLGAGRLNPMEMLGGGHKCRDIKGIHRMLAKAYELEEKRHAS